MSEVFYLRNVLQLVIDCFYQGSFPIILIQIYSYTRLFDYQKIDIRFLQKHSKHYNMKKAVFIKPPLLIPE